MVSATAEALAPSVDSTLGTRLLPTVLSLTAGSADVISFLGLGGLFNSHITGNLVILSAHLVDGESAPIALLLSVPVFAVGLFLTRLFAGALEAIGIPTLRPLLLLQLVLLAGFRTHGAGPADRTRRTRLRSCVSSGMRQGDRP
jgi:uncharacterized membrane protein YoaK (UPF0700 family)